MGNAIYSRLSTDTTVSGLVGNRIYPEQSTEDIYPLIVYSIEQDPEESLTTLELKEFTATLTIVATSYDSAHAIADAVQSRLDRQGSGSGTWGGLTVRIANLQTPVNENQYSDGGNPERIYYSIEQEYKVWVHTE